MKRNIKYFWIIIIVLIVSFIGIYFYHKKNSYYGFLSVQSIESFAMQDENGDVFTEKELSQNPTYICFGYLHCNGICQRQIQRLRAVASKIQEKNIRFIFMTIDPERDTLSQLKLVVHGGDSRFKAIRTENNIELEHFLSYFRFQYAPDFFSNNNVSKQYHHSNFIVLIHPSLKKFIYYPDGLNEWDQFQKDFYRFTKE